MKLENIKENYTYRNYKHLCEVLEIKPVGGKSKKYKLQELERHFEVSKEGNKIIIGNRISNIPKRKARNEVFVNDIETTLLYVLANGDKNVICSLSKALQLTSLVNSNYSANRLNPVLVAKKYNVEQDCAIDFFDRTQKQLKATFERALNRLRSKALIMWESTMIVCVDGIHIPMSIQEKQYILKTELMVLKELGYKEIKEVIINGKWKLFNKKVCKRLKDLGNVEYYYKAYNITLNEEGISLAIDELEYNNTKSKLNNTVCKRIVTNASKRHKKRLKDG